MAKILVVEDDQRIRRLLTLSLPVEFDVRQVGDGKDAINETIRFKPDVMLLDINLPGLNGIEVLRHLKNVSPRPQVIVVSAREDDLDRKLAISLGAAEYFVKPFSPVKLLRAIERLLGVAA